MFILESKKGWKNLRNLWVNSYKPVELYNLCDDSKISTGEEAFDKIRQWLNRNKDNYTRLKAAATYQGVCNQTPLHQILELHPPLDIVQTFIQYAPEALQMRDIYQRLPIHIACSHGASLEVIRALVNSCPENIKVASNNGHLPLHFACHKKASLDIVAFLIESYPTSVKITASDGRLPLHSACWNKSALEVITFLIDSYPDSIKVKDIYGRLPLHGACQKKVSPAVVTFLIDSYPYGIDQTDRNDETPLDWLKRTEYAIDKDSKGMLPLHHACNNGFSSYFIHFLIQTYPKGTTVQDNDGNTPFQYLNKTASRVDERGMLLLHREAMHFRGLNVEMLPILFHANPEAVCLQDKSGLLPIHYAMLNEASSLDALMLLVKLHPESIIV